MSGDVSIYENIKVNKHILNKITNNIDVINIINDAVYRTNNIVSHTYNFLKLYFLYLYNNNISFPYINRSFILLIMSQVSKKITNQGRINNNIEKEKINKFYLENYKELITEDNLVNNKNLSYILNYEADNIIKNINTNITKHFVKHLKKFLNIKFKEKIKSDIIKEIHLDKLKNIDEFNLNKITNIFNTKIYKKEIDRKVKSEIYKILTDILNISDDKLISNNKFHKWINKNKYKFIPKKDNYLKKSISYDIKVNPFDYLKYFIYINSKFEKKEIKTFNCLPLKHSFISSYITIDTPSLICLLCDNSKGKLLKNCNENKNEIWNKFFKLDNKVFKKKNYKFSYMISTDGVGTSIFLKKYINDKEVKLTFEQKLKLEKYREELDKRYIENQENIKEILEDKNYVVIDPNKESLIYCLDKNDNKFRYTQSQRRTDIRTKKYADIIEQDKIKKKTFYKNEKKTIKEVESILSNYNSKTTNLELFKDYIKIRDQLYKKLSEYYKKSKCRKFKMNRYSNTQRSEAKMINNFKNKFGTPEETIIIMGDHDTKGYNMRNKESAICKRIKYLFRKNKYDLYLINEYNTSKKCNKCESNVKFKFYTRPGEENPVWGLVCCKNKNCLQALNTETQKDYRRIMNRDMNAVLNMRKILEELIKTNKRLKNYCRCSPC